MPGVKRCCVLADPGSCLARPPGTKQDREIGTAGVAVSIEIGAGDVPESEQNREIGAVDDEVAIEIANATTRVGRAFLTREERTKFVLTSRLCHVGAAHSGHAAGTEDGAGKIRVVAA